MVFTMLPPDQAENKKTNYGIYLDRRYGRVLELGPYDGTDSVYLARNCDELTCIEGRFENVDATISTLEREEIANACVIAGDLETFDLASLGTFDCVWASGILYHVQDPAFLIRRITQCTKRCFGWTHLSRECAGDRHGYVGSEYSEAGDRLSGLSAKSWWLCPDEFLRIWSDLLWDCQWTTEPTPHPNGGLAACFLADGLAE